MTENERIFQQYRQLVSFLGKVLGSGYEIVLQDVSSPNPGIIAIENGRISGRTIGSPLTDWALKTIEDRVYETKDFVSHYNGRTRSGNITCSSTMFIKNSKGKLIGLLCINFDASQYQLLQQNVMNMLIPGLSDTILLARSDQLPGEMTPGGAAPARPVPEAISERFHADIDEVLSGIYEKALADLTVPVDRLTQEERLALLRRLNGHGFFQLKGAVAYAAEHLGVSQATMYRYLSILKQDN